MATVPDNILMSGIRGKLGELLVFRTIGGKTFVSMKARRPDKSRESAAQRNTRSKFAEASKWAKSIINHPEKKAYYEQRAKALNLSNAYTAAIKDYMRDPKT